MASTDNPPTDTFLGTLVSEWHNMYNISHNYMFQPILGHLQVVSYSLVSVVA